MPYISQIKIRGFKTFDKIELEFPKDFICFAGPNGSGKSNICDAIRFGLGETRLKELRARKIKDLIGDGKKTAEVEVIFSNGKKISIKRIIREDGKMQYRLNGKKAKKYVITNVLREIGIDGSWRNIIPQGEVDRVIKMNGKERRAIIDAASGISEYEDKKKEALSNLAIVEQRIKDAKLILGEKRSYLEELEKEKIRAEQYIEANKIFKNARMTLIKRTITKLKQKIDKLLVEKQEKTKNLEKLIKEQEDIENKLKEIETKRSILMKELKNSQTSSLMVRLEQKRADLRVLSENIENNKKRIEEIKQELITKQKEKQRIEKEINEIEQKIKEIREELNKIDIEKNELVELKSNKIREELEELEQQLIKIRVDRENNLSELIEIREEFAKLEDSEVVDVEQLERKKRAIEQRMDELFSKEKEISKAINSIDKEMLEKKEQRAMQKALAKPRVLEYINTLKTKIKGIKGVVGELIKFDKKFSDAIEASAGSRLGYVIVDDLDVAREVIAELNKVKIGRASFIPLRDVRVPSQVDNSIINYIDYPIEVERAMQYVFAGTKLVNSYEEGKRSKERAVTLNGEVFESSKVVSGGKSTSLLSILQSKNWEKEIDALAEKKRALYETMSKIREEMGELRGKRSLLDIKIRENKGKEVKDIRAIREQKQLLEQKEKEFNIKIEQLEKKINELKRLHKEITEKEQKELSEKNKQREQKISKYMGLKGKLEAEEKYLGSLKEQLFRLSEEEKENKKKIEEVNKTINKKENKIEEIKKEVIALEKEINEKGDKENKIYKDLKKIESEYTLIGAQKARIDKEKNLLEKRLNAIEVELASSNTRLVDLEKDLEEDFEELEQDDEELKKLIKKNEEIIKELGQVNLAAPEMYAKKREEIGEVLDRIDELDEERRAVLSMIDELEEKKRNLFLETFKKISERFRRLFNEILGFEGELYLDKPNTPFESNLYIRVRKGNKDVYLDSLAGGEKSLVALIFVFAIQSISPAPFYIFDEVDSALDIENAKRFGRFIKEYSKEAQIIIVSHRENVIKEASVIYGVSMKNGKTNIFSMKMKE